MILHEPQLQKSNWPVDPLMSALKGIVEYKINDFVNKLKPTIDSQDLKYQTLFRLTSYSPNELFENGEVLEAYLKTQGAYTNWKRIPLLDKSLIAQFEPKNELITSIIEEQHTIINARLLRSDLPLARIIKKPRLSANEGWHLHKTKGTLFVAKGRSYYDVSSIIKTEIHEVDVDYANTVFKDLHYIHTPRAKVAIGLFTHDEDLPLSIVGISPIDRDYKKDVLLIQGYQPEKCWEVVRLYSNPGAPMNTSSVMLSQAVAYIKKTHPDSEACLSAFMPSFANGRSMLAGGFRSPILAKPLKLTFGKAQIGAETNYEMLTNRRLSDFPGATITSKLLLLPTLELIRKIRSPRMQPLIEPSHMVVMNNLSNLI